MGALLHYMSPKGVENVHEVLLRMIYQKDLLDNSKTSIWEVRHAGMLGLKYAVAVRKDLVNMMLDGTVGAVILGYVMFHIYSWIVENIDKPLFEKLYYEYTCNS